MNGMIIIETENLSKRYGNFYAVKNLNLQIEKGKVFGFLGPNGAGKTTTIAMLTGILHPTEGSIRLFGKNLYDDYFNIKKRIGVVPEQQYMYGNMSAYRYLSFFADLYGVKNKEERIKEVLNFVELYEYRNKKLKEYSKGMRQKINIARSLIHNPDIFFFDEPSYGLDPIGVKEVRDIIFNLKNEGKTIFISSHILSEIEKICDEIGIINGGILIEKGNLDQLRNFASEFCQVEIEIEKIKDIDNLIDELKKFDFVKDVVKEKENVLRVKIINEDYRGKISRYIFEKGYNIVGMSVKKATLEDMFVKLTRDDKKENNK